MSTIWESDEEELECDDVPKSAETGNGLLDAAQEHISDQKMKKCKMMDPILDAVLDLLDKKEAEESDILYAMLKIKELDVGDDDDQKDAPLQSFEKVHAVMEERKKKVSEKIASFFADIKVSTVDDIMFVQRGNYVCSFDAETEFDAYEEESIMDVIRDEFETSTGEIV